MEFILVVLGCAPREDVKLGFGEARLSLGRRGCSKSNGGQGFPAAHDARGPRGAAGRTPGNQRVGGRRRTLADGLPSSPLSLTRSKGPHRPILRGVPRRTRRRVRIVQPEQPRRPPEGLSRLGGVFPAPFGLGLVRVRRHCAAGGSARGESKVWRALVVLFAGRGRTARPPVSASTACSTRWVLAAVRARGGRCRGGRTWWDSLLRCRRSTITRARTRSPPAAASARPLPIPGAGLHQPA